MVLKMGIRKKIVSFEMPKPGCRPRRQCVVTCSAYVRVTDKDAGLAKLMKISGKTRQSAPKKFPGGGLPVCPSAKDDYGVDMVCVRESAGLLPAKKLFDNID